MSSPIKELVSRVNGTIRLEEPLAQYTTYRIGGPARAVLTPHATEDVVTAVRFCNDAGVRWLPLGLGSNVLIDDAGFDGLVIRLGKALDWVEEGVLGREVWQTGAGMPTPRLAKLTARAGLSGIQRLIGVPGTVGGGVVMNAGAHGQDFSQVVLSVEVVERDGTVKTLPAGDLKWSYRESGIEGVIVTAVRFGLTPGDPEVLTRDIQRYFAWRKQATPFDMPCCGSVFRNPGGDEARSAGRLIEAAGMKGFQIGGSRVSSRHANYIVNVGNAIAADVKAVIAAVREQVLKEFGIELQLEVRIIE
jgi:UDP-N-acetylmuramate dehydrogenase